MRVAIQGLLATRRESDINRERRHGQDLVQDVHGGSVDALSRYALEPILVSWICVQLVLGSWLNRVIEQWINNVKKVTPKPSRESRSTSITTIESIISNDSPETAASIYGCEPVVRLAEDYSDLGFPPHSR